MNRHRAFTLLELLVVIAILTALIAILVPSLNRARASAKTVLCVARLGQLGKGWQMYADDHRGVMVPGRMFEVEGGTQNPANWYDVGNGLKYRPRWAATMGAYVGAPPFSQPSTTDDRQNYDDEIYQCPQVPQWTDERNYGFGYNYQFLGNARRSNDRFHNFPVFSARLRATGRTVMAADCMGTAAGFPTRERHEYQDNGREQNEMANHGWTLDPPRLTAESDHGTGDPDSRRTAVDPRHAGRVNAVFCDGHAQTATDSELGYRTHEHGRYVDLDPVGDPQPHNRHFSLSGRDDDPPPQPR